ncbi:hypothetical protein PENSPDRAFT_657860 [Peniophora sp. CONT]|nr:hypothetical protein PENSPDRAFT_657860 [Peniophora sp. CONT]
MELVWSIGGRSWITIGLSDSLLAYAFNIMRRITHRGNWRIGVKWVTDTLHPIWWSVLEGVVTSRCYWIGSCVSQLCQATAYIGYPFSEARILVE